MYNSVVYWYLTDLKEKLDGESDLIHELKESVEELKSLSMPESVSYDPDSSSRMPKGQWIWVYA